MIYMHVISMYEHFSQTFGMYLHKKRVCLEYMVTKSKNLCDLTCVNPVIDFSLNI